MGSFEKAARRAILDTFDGASGETKGGVEPFFVERKQTRKDAIIGEAKADGGTLDLRYSIVDATLDDADAARIVVIAYLDWLTRHHWYNENHGRFAGVRLRLTNRDSGVSSETPYPDPE